MDTNEIKMLADKINGRARKAAQRARDGEALNNWVQAGCPKPPLSIWNTIQTWAQMLKWIRKEYGKDETK